MAANDQPNDMPTPVPFLDFYGEREIIPVRQDISDLAQHFRKRRALYRHLGLPPGTFRGHRILEFGPGSGDDAVHTSSLGPDTYILVDGNQASVDAIRAKIADGRIWAPTVECRHSEILAYEDCERYDVVIAEGLVPGQSDPASFLRHLAGFLDDDGVIFHTTHSATSLLAEVCRRMVKPIFARRYPDFHECLRHLTSFFSTDLNSLPGMTRLHEDWVLDTVLHPWGRQVVFSIVDAMDALGTDFEVLGTSPRFEQDWRWYKAAGADPSPADQHVRVQMDAWAAYLIDYRVEPTTGLSMSSVDLEAHCLTLFDWHIEIWRDDDVDGLMSWLADLDQLGKAISGDLPSTAGSIEDYAKGMRRLAGGDLDADFGRFSDWFGRGMQYVSFLKVSAQSQ